MTGATRVDAPTGAGWPDLVDEFDRWGEAGRIATLWWRDDDAVAATPQLADLLQLAGETPVALAVIPALARVDLAAALGNAPQVVVVQHGWRHVDRAGHGKKSEYPAGRPATMVGAEIGAGRARLNAVFGSRTLPLLVPPWNRFADEFLPVLPAIGVAGLSVMASRHTAAMPPGLARIDVHVDLVAWRADRGFIGTDAALRRLVDCLRASRCDAEAAPTPIGILTHHLIMDGATADFLARLIELTGSHAAARWAAVSEFLQ